eukprot:239866-Lingulodinium_polyedra.AAC.1
MHLRRTQSDVAKSPCYPRHTHHGARVNLAQVVQQKNKRSGPANGTRVFAVPIGQYCGNRAR